MKQLLLICAVLAGGCASTPKVVPNSPEAKAAIRKELGKATGKLTKADFEEVTELVLNRNQLTDVTGLEKLTQLKELKLMGNELTSVQGLENLTHLDELHLSYNQLTDMTGLEKLTQLTELRLNGNQLSDVTGLEKHTQLMKLELAANTDLTKSQIDELQKALPKCKITHNAKQ